MPETAFGRLFARTGGPSLIRQFGEPVTYYPRDGGSRVIQAIVERGDMEVIAETGGINSQAIVVRVRNDVRVGIASDEVDTGGDELGVPLREGESAQRRSIVRVLNDNGGMVRLLIQ